MGDKTDIRSHNLHILLVIIIGARLCVAYRTIQNFIEYNSQNNEICLKGGLYINKNLLIKS